MSWEVELVDAGYQKIADKFELTSKVCAVATIAAIVLSTTATAILFHLTILFVLLAGNWKEKFNLIVRNPLALVFSLLFLLSLVGATYSTAPMHDVLMMLRKYGKYLLAVMFLPLFVEEKWRDYAIFSFFWAIAATLLISYLREYGYWYWWINNGAIEVFKNSIDFNFLMAFAAYLCLFKVAATRGSHRLGWVTFLIIIVHTILFRSQGRIGYFVFAGLMILFFYQKFRWRGFIIAVTSAALLFGLAFSFSSMFKERMSAALNDIKTHQQNDNTSVGLRMTFAINGMKLIKNHPIFGTGTGSYVKEYVAITSLPPDAPGILSKPHNEYIHITVQFGILGLIVLLIFFAVPLRYSQFLPEREKYIARGIVIGLMLASLVNASLLDTTIRYCYIYFAVLAFAALPRRHGRV